MIVNKKIARKSAIKASNARVASRRRAVRAADDVEDVEIDEEVSGGGVNVAPEASDLLFEAEDVAELIAEVTGQDVAVTADEDLVKFEVGGEEFTVSADGDEEILESTRKALRGKKPVRASRLARRAASTRRAVRR